MKDYSCRVASGKVNEIKMWMTYAILLDLSLVSPMLLVAILTVDRPALRWFERDFGFGATFRTCDFVHRSTAVSSFFTHRLLTPLFRLVTRKIVPKLESAAYRPLMYTLTYLKLY